MPAPGSAAFVVDEPRSASAIVGGELVGHHVLHIDGYSRIKDELPTGKSIQSRPFSAGGRRWSILYYPNGQTSEEADFVSVFLHLTKSADGPVKARATFDLLDGAGNPLPLKSRTLDLFEFSPGGSVYGFPKFIKKEFLEKSEHLLNDRFKISCDIIIPEELRTEDRIVSLLDAVPPPDLNQHLGDLLMSKEGADVTFQVAGESFCAHRCLLAARSRVFKAELWGAMKESTATGDCIRIDDMLPQVFKALLHFIYTDSLPQMEEQEEAVMAQHLLEAADRYDMQRLKLICEEKLYRHLDVSTAATTLVLAEQHCCRGLKQACIEFLKSPDALEAIMETDGFEHLTKSCPALVKELMSELYLFKQCKRRKLKT
jgi:speckle-type POZ protein